MPKMTRDLACQYARQAVMLMITIEDVWTFAPTFNIHIQT
jgi:hypothetical protein